MDGFRSGSMFCVVDFVRGRKRTVVPDSWLSVNETLCLLPPNATESDLEALVRNHAEPGEGWQMLEVDSVETFRSYSEAKIQLKNSKEASQPESSISQRKRKKPSYLEDYSTRDSDDGRKLYTVFGMDFDEEAMSENEWIPPPEFNPRIEKVTSVKKKINKDNRPRSLFSQPQLSSEKENIDSMCDCQSSCHGTFLKALHKLLEQQQSMQKQQQSMQKQQQSMLEQQQSMQKQLDRTNQLVQQLVESQKQTYSQSRRVLEPQPVNQMDAQEEMDALSQSKRVLEPQPLNQMDAQEEMDALLQSKRVLEPLAVNKMDAQEEMDALSQDGTSFAQSKQSTFAAPKNTENQRTFSETGDTCITRDKPATAEEMEHLIKSTLPGIDDQSTSSLAAKLDEIGVILLEDLQYVEERDISDILKPSQLKIFLKFCHQTIPSSSVENSNSFMSEKNSPVVGNSNATNSRLAEMPPSSSSWAHNFQIDWNMLPKEIEEAHNKNILPSQRHVSDMIRILIIQLTKFVKSPGRKEFRIIADKIACKYPNLFQDSKVIGRGCETLARKLEYCMDNQNRRNKTFERDFGTVLKRKTIRSSYGCLNWQPSALPKNQTKRTQMQLKQWLISEFPKAKRDEKEVENKMKMTYASQRYFINYLKDSIITVKDQWPFLLEEKHLLNHTNELINVDFQERFSSSVPKIGKMIFNFMQTKNTTESIKSCLDCIQNAKLALGNNTPEVMGAVPLVMAYFNEEQSLLFRDDSDSVKSSTPLTPHVTTFGSTLYEAEKYAVVIDGVPTVYAKNFTSALMCLFASYFVYNIEYNEGTEHTMEFIQRSYASINPGRGSKAPKKKNYSISPKVLKLFNELQYFETML